MSYKERLEKLKLSIVAREKGGYCHFCGETNIGYSNTILVPEKKSVVLLCEDCKNRFLDSLEKYPECREAILKAVL